MNTTNAVVVTLAKQVMTIAWHRPDKKNALTQAMYSHAAEALVEAGQDSQVRAVIITGTQACFTAGNDLNDFLQNPAIGDDTGVGRFLSAIARFEKPLIGAVNGPVVGVGTTMLLHCDLVVAADTAVFKLPFASLGLCPEAGSSYLLPLLMGYHRAAELLLLGEAFDAEHAKDCGIVNRIASADDYLDVATEMAEKLAALPPSSIRTTKAFLKQGNQAVVEERMVSEADQFAQLLKGPEAIEAMTAFIERRDADFSQF
jgi:enoyl-CoA hydratase/carnithine racemase